MMDQIPVGPASPVARKSHHEKPGARQAGKNDFKIIMDERHPRLGEEAGQESGECIGKLAAKEKAEQADSETLVPIVVSAIPLLDRHLTAHRIATDNRIETPHGFPEIEPRLSRQFHPAHSNSQALTAGSVCLEGRDGQSVRYQVRRENPEIPQLFLKPDSNQRQASTRPAMVRIARDSDSMPTQDRAEPLHTGANFKNLRSNRVPRAPAEHGGGDESATHAWAGSQRDAPVHGTQVAVPQAPAVPGSILSPAEQIVRRLSEAVSVSINEPPAPMPGTAVKSLRIILEPEQLGIVHVSLTMKADGLHVRIAASEAVTAGMLQNDRHQLDNLLRPLAGNGLVAAVTISIEPLREMADALPGPVGDQRPQGGSPDSGLHHSSSRHEGHADTSRPAMTSTSGKTDEAHTHEDISPARAHQPGVVVV